MRTAPLLLVVAALGALGACGDDDPDTSDTTDETTDAGGGGDDGDTDGDATLAVRLEPTDAIFIEGFEVGLRFTDAASGDEIDAWPFCLAGALFFLGILELNGRRGPDRAESAFHAAVTIAGNLLAAERPLAYTTVMTVLDNLHTKGWVARSRDGRAYHYQARSTREEYAARLMQDALAEASDRVGTLVTFAEQLSAGDIEALRAAVKPRKGPKS